MRAIILNAALLLTIVPRCFSQEFYPKNLELFGGYSHISKGFHGWNASFAGKPKPWIGIVGDFSGHYGNYDILLGSSLQYLKSGM